MWLEDIKQDKYDSSLSISDENLVVGTRQGHLLMYSVTQHWNVSILRSNKNFSRKPIVQVAVVPEHQIIVSLSGTVRCKEESHNALLLNIDLQIDVTIFLWLWRAFT